MNRHPLGRTGWASTLNKAQRAAVQRIKAAANAGDHDGQTEGWTVYLMPSTGPAKYCELRHHLAGGIARWVIEPDGSVSAENDRGQLAELRAA